MGQALINYLQRGNVNDTPIVPPPVQEAETDIPEAPADENDDASLDTADIIAQVDEALENATIIPPVSDDPSDSEEITAEEVPAEDAPVEDPSGDAEDVSVEVPCEEIAPLTDAEEPQLVTEESAEESVTPSDDEPITEEIPVCEESTEEDPTETDTEQILAQADDLIAHELPSPVVPPEPIEVKLPEPVPAVEVSGAEESPVEEETQVTEKVSDDAPESPSVSEDQEAQIPEDEQDDKSSEEDLPSSQDDEDTSSAKSVHRSNRRLITAIICCITAIVLLLGGFLFYEEYYLQNIDSLTISGDEDRLIVGVSGDANEALLSVVCTDTYGTAQRQNVVNGVAVFENLSPGMNYKIQVRIDGFHQLTGNTSTTYTTAQMTIVSDLHGSIGPENGSLLLTFSVQGPDAQQWTIHYSAPGEEVKSVTFTGHMVTVTDLTIGKEYSIILEPSTDLYLVGETTLSFFSSNVIVPENLQILGFRNDGLHLTWSAPEGESVKSWSVRCYNDTYDQTFTTTDPSIVLDGLDNTAGYTIEVTADGMSVNARAFLPAGSTSIQQILLDDSVKGSLKINWTFWGIAPEDGWKLLYSVDGSDVQVISCDSPEATLYPIVPGGTYSISIQSTNGSSVFGGNTTYAAPSAESFSGYGITSDTVSMKMCITPSIENWDRWDVKDKDFTTTFGIGVSASFTTRLTTSYSKSDDEIVTMLVIRDAQGKLISIFTENNTWSGMWKQYRGKFTIPTMPDQVGDYTIEIYYNFAHVTTRTFTITE